MTEWKHGHTSNKEDRIDKFIDWRKENPDATRKDCMKHFKCSRTTVYNYEKEIKRRLNNDKM